MELAVFIFAAIVVAGLFALPGQIRSSQAPRPDESLRGTSPGLGEYKEVKVPTGNGGRKARQRILNRLAREGWELVEIRRGGVLFGTKDTAILRRHLGV